MIPINKSTLIKMLEAASCAYKDNLPSCKLSFYEIIRDTATDTECFIKKSGSEITIIFRGTDSKTNWVYNFLFGKKEIPYDNTSPEIKVHSGFLSGYKSVRDRIHKKIPSDICRITVTGHSLGAALAVLCAVDIQYNFKNADVEAYLFGCPRVGNKSFAASYDRRVFKTLRITNGNDIVCKLPPKIFGYRHVGIDLPVGSIRLPFVFTFSSHRPKSYYKKLWTRL